MNKNRVIPKLPEEERASIEYGYHKVPTWLIILFTVIVIVGWVGLIFYN